MCPLIAAAVEIDDPRHPARRRAHDCATSAAHRFAETARETGATEPDVLGERLALLLDGASARTGALGVDALPTAATIAATPIDGSVPEEPPAAAGT